MPSAMNLIQMSIVETLNENRAEGEEELYFNNTDIMRYPFPLPLQNGAVYAFQMWTPERKTIYVAVIPEYEPVHLFSFAVFEELLLVNGFTISTSEQALAYTKTIFTLVPPLPGLFYLISRASDLPVSNEEDRAGTVARFESVITPPAVTTTEEGYEITFYACHNDTLRYYTVQCSSSGHVEESSKIVAEGLPLPVRL